VAVAYSNFQFLMRQTIWSEGRVNAKHQLSSSVTKLWLLSQTQNNNKKETMTNCSVTD